MRWLALLLLAACAAETGPVYPPSGTWRLVEVDGQAAPGEATLTFPAPEFVAGTLPCNAFTAHQHAAYPAFILSHLEIGTGVCDEAVAERSILDGLASVTGAEVRGGAMVLSGGGREMVFRR